MNEKNFRYILQEHFYHQRTSGGFVEYKLEQIRLKMNPEVKNRTTSPEAHLVMADNVGSQLS